MCRFTAGVWAGIWKISICGSRRCGDQWNPDFLPMKSGPNNFAGEWPLEQFLENLWWKLKPFTMHPVLVAFFVDRFLNKFRRLGKDFAQQFYRMGIGATDIAQPGNDVCGKSDFHEAIAFDEIDVKIIHPIHGIRRLPRMPEWSSIMYQFAILGNFAFYQFTVKPVHSNFLNSQL